MIKRWPVMLAMILILASATTVLLLRYRGAQPEIATIQDPLRDAKSRLAVPESGSGPRAPPVEKKVGEQEPEAQPDAPDEPIVTKRPSLRDSNFWDLLDSYDRVDQDLIRRFDRRYRGALQFQSEEQLAWMEEHGYPMPEHILEARSLTDNELRAAAAGGNDKYLFLYADRVLQNLIATKRQYLSSGLDPATIDEYPEFTRQFVEATRINTELAQSDSPFAGYAMSQLYWITTGDAYSQLAALHLTIARGDHRAHKLVQALIRESDLPPEVGEALIAYAVLVRQTQDGSGDVMPFGP